MRLLDWTILIGSLVFIVVYGVARSRHQRDMKSFLLASRDTPWPKIALSIIATQASAITFLSAPGQAYVDGMRFVQFYFGLPIAMVILSMTAVPIFHKLKVFTAYEYLEGRFDLKTRGLAAGLFLAQRGLATGLTIYAPALILSVLLGWSITVTTLIMGTLVVIYTTSGGARAVNETQMQQLLIIFTGMASAFVVVLTLLPRSVGFLDAVHVAGALGRLNIVDLRFDLNSRYNLWSGLIGGLFLSLSYFGTDQSQVQRYLTGRSVTQSRLALLFNGLFKIPMQFGILFLGAMVFVVYQFTPPPVFFNPVELARLAESPRASELQELNARHTAAFEARKRAAEGLVEARHSGDAAAATAAGLALKEAHTRVLDVRRKATDLMKANEPRANTSDTNYVFLSFVLKYLPTGLVGLILAAIFAASMSSTAAELNALSTTSCVDIYLRLIKRDGRDAHYVQASRFLTVFWGALAVAFAQYASRLGSLIEAVNILGSLFYGTILGIFLVAFYFESVDGTSVFWAAVAGEATVIALFVFKAPVEFLWYNAVGCLVVVSLAVAFAGLRSAFSARRETSLT